MAGALTRNFFNPLVQEIENTAEEETHQARMALNSASNSYRESIANLVHQASHAPDAELHTYLLNQVKQWNAECDRLHKMLVSREAFQTMLAHAMERITSLHDNILELFERGLILQAELRATREQIMALPFMREDDV
jgi:hypothetical protein